VSLLDSPVLADSLGASTAANPIDQSQNTPSVPPCPNRYVAVSLCPVLQSITRGSSPNHGTFDNPRLSSTITRVGCTRPAFHEMSLRVQALADKRKKAPWGRLSSITKGGVPLRGQCLTNSICYSVLPGLCIRSTAQSGLHRCAIPFAGNTHPLYPS